MNKTCGWGFVLVVLGLAFPTFVTITVGLGLVFENLVLYLLIALLAELILGIALIVLEIYRTKIKGTDSPIPIGSVNPFWIRTTNIYTLLSLLDLVAIILFFELSRFSQYSQQVAIYLMAVFLPLVYLGSFIFRDGYLAVVDRSFSYPINRLSTSLWLNSSLARVLLRHRLDSGVFYLTKSLIAAKKVCESVGRSPDNIDDVIGLLRLAIASRVPLSNDKLLSFTDSLFSDGVPMFDKLPDEAEKLLKSFPWFSHFHSQDEKKPESRLSTREKSSSNIPALISALGAIGSFGVALLQFGAQSFSGLSSFLQQQGAPLVLIALAAAVLYLPFLHLRASIAVFVSFTDLKAYAEGFAGKV